MALDVLDIVTRFTTAIAEPGGVRTHCQQILDELKNKLPARYGFVIIEAPETEKLEVLAAAGLDAVTFRRLEARAASSALLRIFDRAEPIDLLVNDEPTLDFLAIPSIATEIISVPILTGPVCIGSVSLAFQKKRQEDKPAFIKLIQIAAALIAQTNRSDRLANEESERLAAENVTLKRELKDKHDFGTLIGNSTLLRQVYVQVTQVARSNATILLRGESGTGKDMLAAAIHYNSLRSKGPFVTVNCSTLPAASIDGELFGGDGRTGLIEQAERGTLFLDEVLDLPLTTQARLLRVLEDRVYERPGDKELAKANVRIITASSKPLEDAVAAGDLRQDLFYRLNAFTVYVPPLRERKSDILLLADFFLEKYAAEHGKRIRRITTPAIDMLTAYHFPGNVRELENAIERAVLVCDTNVIHGHHLPPTLQTAEVSDTEPRLNLVSAVSTFESDMIQDALKSTRGNIAKAAMMLDSTERILGYKIKKYGIDPSRFKRWNAANS